MINFMFKIFVCTNKIQKYLLKKHMKLVSKSRISNKSDKKIAKIILLIILILATASLLIFSFTRVISFEFYIVSVLIIILGVLSFAVDLIKSFVSIRRFLSSAALSSVFIAGAIATVTQNTSIQLIIFAIAFCLLWIFWSLIANTKVATLSNAIVAAVLGIITISSSILIPMLSFDNILPIFSELPPEVIAKGYTYESFLQLCINFLLLPVVVTNILAALACQMKSYWLERHSTEKEISWKDLSDERK